MKFSESIEKSKYTNCIYVANLYTTKIRLPTIQRRPSPSPNGDRKDE
jgi:hypothetical protein